MMKNGHLLNFQSGLMIKMFLICIRVHIFSFMCQIIKVTFWISHNLDFIQNRPGFATTVSQLDSVFWT